MSCCAALLRTQPSLLRTTASVSTLLLIDSTYRRKYAKGESTGYKGAAGIVADPANTVPAVSLPIRWMSGSCTCVVATAPQNEWNTAITKDRRTSGTRHGLSLIHI